jgi:hypothetical protein
MSQGMGTSMLATISLPPSGYFVFLGICCVVFFGLEYVFIGCVLVLTRPDKSAATGTGEKREGPPRKLGEDVKPWWE